MDDFKLLIAMPTYETAYPQTFKSIFDQSALRKGVHADFECVTGYGVDIARNRIADYAIENGYSHVLMVDNDIVLPPNALEILLDDIRTPNRMCVLGWYLKRPQKQKQTDQTVLYKNSGGQNYDDHYVSQELLDISKTDDPIIKIRGGGLGCAMIASAVFDQIKYPYFKYREYENHTRLSEDLFFCSKLRKENIAVYADTRVACGHMVRHIQEVYL